MARPREQGLRFFALDVTEHADPKILRLRSRLGDAGWGQWHGILQMIYAAGDRLPWASPEDRRVIAAALAVPLPRLCRVVAEATEVGLLDHVMLAAGTLSSEGIQRRFQLATAEREKKRSQRSGLSTTNQGTNCGTNVGTNRQTNAGKEEGEGDLNPSGSSSPPKSPAENPAVAAATNALISAAHSLGAAVAPGQWPRLRDLAVRMAELQRPATWAADAAEIARSRGVASWPYLLGILEPCVESGKAPALFGPPGNGSHEQAEDHSGGPGDYFGAEQVFARMEAEHGK